jgi:hypothetical protein
VAIHFGAAFQGIRQLRCGLTLVLLNRPLPLPIGNMARMALFSLEDGHDTDRHDPSPRDGSADHAPPSWASMSPEQRYTMHHSTISNQ